MQELRGDGYDAGQLAKGPFEHSERALRAFDKMKQQGLVSDETNYSLELCQIKASKIF